MPLALAMFLVQYLSRPGDLIVDPFGGTLTTARAAETLGRMWMATEIMAEYLMGGRFRFTPEELSSREHLDWLFPVAA
jgi:DNA modification methylase